METPTATEPMLRLRPTIALLREEYVLVQAWKKAHDYIRYHNWYADVLELDLTTARLPKFIKELQNALETPAKLKPDPLRLVLAPKPPKNSATWTVKDGVWSPPLLPPGERLELRPLAHTSLRDQTLAIAMMMCLADIVETRQGDPSPDGKLPEARQKKMASYGNRLFCDPMPDKTLRYRWANASAYRKWHKDYKAFVKRPRQVASQDFPNGRGFAIVHADLSKFYDRVRPATLLAKVKAIQPVAEHEAEFLTAFQKLFNWKWSAEDIELAKAQATPLVSAVALPQGLVASGFFANLFLLDFDAALWREVKQPNKERPWRVVDYCRYVDDLRLVIAYKPDGTKGDIEDQLAIFLQALLEQTAPNLEVNPRKVKVLIDYGSSSGEVTSSDSVERIQENVSGAMDIEMAQSTLQMIEGLDSLRDGSDLDFGKEENFLTTGTDIRDDTLARFAAGRWRKTYRSLRPLLPETWDRSADVLRKEMSRDELDHRAAFYSKRLIEHWLHDPSQMRLLRLGLDIYPAAERLTFIQKKLMGLVSAEGVRPTIAWYCIAELFKAGATETGYVEDEDHLPGHIEVEDYRREMENWALSLSPHQCPWYVKQQVLLFLATRSVGPGLWETPEDRGPLADYHSLHLLIRYGHAAFTGRSHVPLLLVWAGVTGDAAPPAECLATWLAADRNDAAAEPVLVEICQSSPELAEATWERMAPSICERWRSLFRDYGYAYERHQTYLPDPVER